MKLERIYITQEGGTETITGQDLNYLRDMVERSPESIQEMTGTLQVVGSCFQSDLEWLKEHFKKPGLGEWLYPLSITPSVIDGYWDEQDSPARNHVVIGKLETSYEGSKSNIVFLEGTREEDVPGYPESRPVPGEDDVKAWFPENPDEKRLNLQGKDFKTVWPGLGLEELDASKTLTNLEI